MSHGGTISGNTSNDSGGGVYVESSATFNMSGAPNIHSNLVGSERSNVYLEGDAVIHVTGNLNNNTPIGVTMESFGVFTNALGSYATAANFTSDNAYFGVDLTAAGEAKLVTYPTVSFIRAEIRTRTSDQEHKSLRYVFKADFNKSNLTIGTAAYGYQTGAEYTLTNLDAQLAAGNSIPDPDTATWHPLYNIFSFDTPDASGNHPGFTFTVVLNGITNFDQNYAVRVRCGYTPISGGAVEYYTLNTAVAKVNGTDNDI